MTKMMKKKITKKTSIPTSFNSLDEVLNEVYFTEGIAHMRRPTIQTLENAALKTLEELGELAAEILKLSQFKTTDESYPEIMDNAKDEVVDHMMMSMVLASHFGMTKEEICERFVIKLKKWRKKHLKPVKPIKVRKK